MKQKILEKKLNILFPEFKFHVYTHHTPLVYHITAWGEGLNIFDIYITLEEINKNTKNQLACLLTCRVRDHLRTIIDNFTTVLERTRRIMKERK